MEYPQGSRKKRNEERRKWESSFPLRSSRVVFIVVVVVVIVVECVDSARLRSRVNLFLEEPEKWEVTRRAPEMSRRVEKMRRSLKFTLARLVSWRDDSNWGYRLFALATVFALDVPSSSDTLIPFYSLFSTNKNFLLLVVLKLLLLQTLLKLFFILSHCWLRVWEEYERLFV